MTTPPTDPPNPPPMSVVCESCQRRLQIRDASLAGTIANCPACGSMVAVPADLAGQRSAAVRQVYGGGSIGSDEMTAEAVLPSDAPEPDRADRPGRSERGAPPVETGSTVAAAAAVDDDRPADEPIEPVSAASFQSDSAAKIRRLAGMVALAVVGVVTIGLVAMVVLSGDDPPAQSEPPETTLQTTLQTTPETPVERAEPVETVDPASVQKNASPQKESPAIEPPPAEVAEPTTTLPRGGLTTEMAPLDLFGPAAPAGAEVADDGGDAMTLDALPEGLGSFTPLLLGEDPQPSENLPPPPSLDDFRLREATRSDDPLVQSESVLIRPKLDLALKVAIKSDPRPVSRWVHLISQISGVPIEIDLVAMDIAGADVATPFAPPPATRPLYELLDDVAAAAGCVVDAQPTLLRLTPAEDVFQTAVARLSKTDGVDRADEIVAALLPPVQSPVDDAAENEPPPGRDAKTLRCIVVQTVVAMRGGDVAIDPVALSRWSVPVGSRQIEWPVYAMERPMDETLYPVNLSAFFGSLEIVTGTAVLPHWDDFLKKQWSAGTTVFPDPALDPPTVIARTLSPVRCDARRMPGGWLWIGSDATYDRLPVVVYAAGLGGRRAGLVDQLRQSIAAVGEVVRWTVDEPSDGVIAVCPRFVARQLSID